MPALFPLHLALTEEQQNWIILESERTKKTKSKVVQDLIDAAKKGESHNEILREVPSKLDQLKAQQHANSSEMNVQLEIILAYVKEIFRESSANLYRLNAIVDEFEEPETVRSEVNEFVCKQESMMRLKVIKIHEDNWWSQVLQRKEATRKIWTKNAESRAKGSLLNGR